MFWPGVATIWSALLAGLTCIWAYWRVDRGAVELLAFARRAYAIFAASIFATSAILMTLLLTHRFDVAYVASYSARDLPLHFLISTFWAGQEGSFLLWIFWGSVIGFFVWRTAREQEAPVMIVYVGTFVALVAILCKQSPFRLLATTPADGTGLNPLLQDYWMVIHPPIMFSGFASLSVPFSFAIAALWKKRWDDWLPRALPWALFTFVTLGTAILMGGYWAYKTLGWGGYWGWDPVENTSLVPWLMTVALVHGMFLQRSRQKHRRVNFSLAILAYVCILYGTFLTRSGVLADFSVHSFVDLGITGWLVADLLGFLALGVGFLLWRWKEIPSPEDETPALSRSVALVLGIAVIVGLAFVILLGTSAPLLSRLWGNPSQVSNKFYRVTATPGGFFLAVLFGLIPFLSWKGETIRSLFKSTRRSLVVAAIAVIVSALFGATRFETLAFIFIAVFAFGTNLQAVVRKTRSGKFGGAGGYLAHAGVSVMLVGIVISGVYAVSRRVTLPKDLPVRVFDTTMTFTNVVPATATTKQAMEIRVVTAKGKSFFAYPKMYVNARTNQLMANPSIRKNPVLDLYISPQEYDPGSPARNDTGVTISQGKSATVGGTTFKFDGFEVDRSKMTAGARQVSIQAHLTVTPPKGPPQRQTLVYVARLDGSGSNDAPPATIAGSARGVMKIAGVSAAEESVTLQIGGLTAAVTPAVPESLSVDVTRKPLISLVWGGFYIMMAGAFTALLKRAKAARELVAADARGDTKTTLPPASPPAAVPVTVAGAEA